MIQLSTIEKQFLKLHRENLSIQDFEEWVYRHEHVIEEEAGENLCLELVLLNYKSKEAKHELLKLLKIDFEKLELFEIQELLLNLLQHSESEFKDFKSQFDYEVGSFYNFKIGQTNFCLSNPLESVEFVDHSTGKEKIELIKMKLEKGNVFIEAILSSIGTEYFRIYNLECCSQMDSLTDGQIIKVKKDEINIIINRHYCYIKKDYLLTKIRQQGYTNP